MASSSSLSSAAAAKVCPGAPASNTNPAVLKVAAAGHAVAVGTPQVGSQVAVMGGRTGQIICATGKGSGTGDAGEDTLNEDVAKFFSKLDDVKAQLIQATNVPGTDPFLTRNLNLQVKLAELGAKSDAFLREVVAHMKPQEGTKLYEDLLETGLRIMCAEVSAKQNQAPWGYAHSLTCELHGLRSLVSSALDAPIPRRTIKLTDILLENDDAQATLLAMVEMEYKGVVSDVKEMLA